MKTFAEHLQELKRRMAMVFVLLLAGSALGFIAHKQIEVFLQRPLSQTLYYSNPAGGLGFVMQISLSVGILCCLPVFMFQIVQFARPAIKPVKTRIILASIISSIVLSILAVLYAYFYSLPVALKFLTSFNSSDVKALIGVNEYLKFLFAYVAGTVLAFQIPLILYFTNKIRRFPPGGLIDLQRPAIVGAIVFAGIITPTVDPMNQLMVAMPIIALFQVGSIAVWVSNRRAKPVVKFEIKHVPDEGLRPLFEVSSAVSAVHPTPVTNNIVPKRQEPVQPITLQTPRPQKRFVMDVFVPAI